MGSFKIGSSAFRCRRRRFAAPKMSWWNLIPSSVEREDDSLWIGQIVCASRHRQPVEGFSIFLKSFPLNYASRFIRPLVVYTRVQLPLAFSSDTVGDVGEKKRIIYFQTQCLSPVRRTVSGTSWPDGGCVKTFGEAAYWLSAVIYASPHGEAGGSTGTRDCKCRVLKHSIYSFVVCVRVSQRSRFLFCSTRNSPNKPFFSLSCNILHFLVVLFCVVFFVFLSAFSPDFGTSAQKLLFSSDCASLFHVAGSQLETGSHSDFTCACF